VEPTVSRKARWAAVLAKPRETQAGSGAAWHYPAGLLMEFGGPTQFRTRSQLNREPATVSSKLLKPTTLG
jgi:hypothetical protein